jgi:hypothetical protein
MTYVIFSHFSSLSDKVSFFSFLLFILAHLTPHHPTPHHTTSPHTTPPHPTPPAHHTNIFIYIPIENVALFSLSPLSLGFLGQ